MKKLLLLLRVFYFCVVALLLSLSLLFAFMQTKWAKQKIIESIALACSQGGIEVKIGHLEGRFPFTWYIEEILIKQNAENYMQLKNIEARIAIFPLIKKTISLSYFNIEEAHIAFAPSSFTFETINLTQKHIKSWAAYHLIIDRLHVESCLCENLSAGKRAFYSIKANGDLSKGMHRFQASVVLTPKDYPDNFVHFNLHANRALSYASAHIETHLTSMQPVEPFYAFSAEAIDLSLSLSGSYKSWEAFFNKDALSSPLLGNLQTHIHFDRLSSLLNRSWTIDTQFSLNSYRSLSLHDCSLQSDLISAAIQAEIKENLKNSTASMSFYLPDLSHFYIPLSPTLNIFYTEKGDFPLKGSAKGEMHYQDQHLIADIFAEDFHYDALAFGELSAHFEGDYINQGWEGNGYFKTQNAALPLTSAFHFNWPSFSILSLYNLSLEGPGLFMSGDLVIDFNRSLCSGALYGQIEHLHSLPFLSHEIGDVSLGIECQFLEDREKQNIRCSLLGKHFLFKNYTLEQFSLTASVSDLFYQPYGHIQLSLEKLQTPSYGIDALDFSSSSQEEEQWSFSLHTNGTWQNPFSLSAQGQWKKEDHMFNIEVASLSGDIFTYSFFLKYPFLFEQGTTFSSLSPVEIHIGDARLFTTFQTSQARSIAQIDLRHFPLKLLEFFHPSHELAGTLSLNGFIDAAKDNIQGSLNAALEEIRFQHFDKKEPLKVKGTLQAHLDHNILQTHTHILATDEQFIDFSATVPIGYTIYPLKLYIDKQQPVSSELIMEGKVQDLFDFINLGTHRASGYISSRLFLSQTLNAPALHGNIEWREGAYENFLTGTVLQDIHAKLQALNDQLDLISFTAKDEKHGTVSGEGTIDLHPEAHFPYAFIAELNHLNAVHFNPLNCQLSGALYITGTTREAIAQGNLLVSQAEFKIPDTLPFEVPVLPVTFIHRPSYLSSQTLLSTPVFPFRIQLELTAEDHVFVTGKGLNSEWKGILLVSGTNMNVMANGTLDLIKGDYALFGKNFKLTEGQIVFNDKPSPSATINLSGSLALADMTIMAHLRGPLSSPVLTLHSNPQISTNAILARILFNKDISDISQPEAIQLATTLISLSGGAGPSVLETIRKNIGVDRLTIASQTANPDEIAVQIGKYLTKGVMITLSQSATSSQIIVEVEFKHGFVFQAETQEEQEGKFSLKWTHSY